MAAGLLLKNALGHFQLLNCLAACYEMQKNIKYSDSVLVGVETLTALYQCISKFMVSA